MASETKERARDDDESSISPAVEEVSAKSSDIETKEQDKDNVASNSSSMNKGENKDEELSFLSSALDKYIKPNVSFAIYFGMFGVMLSLLALPRVWRSGHWFRLFMCIGCTMYFPLVTFLNGIVFGMLRGTRMVIVKSEELVRRIVEVGVERVLNVVGKKDWIRSGELVNTVKKVGGELGNESGVFTGRWLFRVVFGGLAWVVKKRYRGLLEKNGTKRMGSDGNLIMSMDVVRRIMGGELAGAIVAPVKGTIDLYIALIAVEFIVAVFVPFYFLPSANG